MDLIIDIVVIICTSIICIRTLRRVIIGQANVIHFCILSFYVMQTIPLLVKMVWGIDDMLCRYPKMFEAMTDKLTSIWYAVFVIVTEVSLAFLAKTLVCRNRGVLNIKSTTDKLYRSKFIRFVLLSGMFIIVIPVLLSPDPDVYLEFAYFQMHSVSKLSAEYLYHNTVIYQVNRFCFFCCLGFYLITKNSNNKVVYLSILLLTWINGKRTLFTMSLIGILAIDIIDKRYIRKKSRLIIKGVIFLIIILLYFIFYSNITGKFASFSFNHQYSLYFGRMSNVEVSIYDIINGSNMMDYPGQSIIYDMFFWIPRKMWKNKPVLYSKYLTSYVMNYGTVDIDWQLQSNIWSEYISNFGFFGFIIAIFILYICARIIEKTDNPFSYTLGLCFIVLYTMFGFEGMVHVIGIVWALSVVIVKIPHIRIKWHIYSYGELKNEER